MSNRSDASNFDSTGIILLLILVAGYAVLLPAAFTGWFASDRSQIQSPPASRWKPLSREQVDSLIRMIRSSGPSPVRFRIVYNCTDNCLVIANSIRNCLRSAGWIGEEPQLQDFAAQAITGIIVTPGTLGADDTDAWDLEDALKNVGLPVREEDAVGGSVSDPPLVKIIISNKTPDQSPRGHF